MKGERFDQKTGKWVPKPEEQEAPTVKKEVNINVHLKGKRYNSDTLDIRYKNKKSDGFKLCFKHD